MVHRYQSLADLPTILPEAFPWQTMCISPIKASLIRRVSPLSPRVVNIQPTSKMFPAALLSTLLLALVVSANPIVQIHRGPVTLPIARSLNLTGVRSLYAHDLSRAQNFKTRGSDKVKRAVISTVANNEVVKYIETVGVGSPATNCTLINAHLFRLSLFSLLLSENQSGLSLTLEGKQHSDPASVMLTSPFSSNTWIGVGNPYVATTTSHNTGQPVVRLFFPPNRAHLKLTLISRSLTDPAHSGVRSSLISARWDPAWSFLPNPLVLPLP